MFTGLQIAGVLTYNIRCKSKMVVMFSVSNGDRQFVASVVDSSTQCDHQLFRCLSNNEERMGIANSPFIYKSGGVTIKVTMSDSFNPVMEIEVHDC